MGRFLRVFPVGLVVLALGCGGALVLDHDRNGQVLLVASTDDDRIQTFKVGNGSLSPLTKQEDDDNDPSTPDTTVTVGKKDTLFPSLGLAASPGQKLYSATANGVIEQFRIMRSGELEYLDPQTAPLSNGLGGIAITPNGLWLYATASPNKVRMYDIAPGGVLSPKNVDADAGNQPVDIKIAPNGQYAYVANLNDGTISQFSIDGNGVLHALGTPSVPTPSGPQNLSIDSTGAYLYAACPDANKIAIFSIGAGGQLTHTSDVDSPTKAETVAVSTLGFAYSGSAEGDAALSSYSVGAGSLSPSTTINPPTHSGRTRLIISPENFLYVSYTDDSHVSVYRINPDGTIVHRDTESTVSDPGPIVFRYLP